jgi:hypothetical protein
VELGAAKANKEGKDIREFMEQVRKLYFPFAHLFAICTREVDY